MRYRVVGDVLRAFSIVLEDPAFGGLTEDEQKERIASELGLRRLGREEDIRIDFVGEADDNEA